MYEEDLYAFLSDGRLIDLIERVKVSDDFLDVIELSENQHSDMLAWCLHPNEGHGQGDAVVKDFLIAAFKAGSGANKFLNKKFFEKWTPGRIRTTSFGAAFIAREFSVQIKIGEKKGRLDLFLIDPVNRIVVTIENKAGASLSSSQLTDYYDAVVEQIGRRPVFHGYDFAHVVVDKGLDGYSEEHIESLGNKWALLDYAWLSASANRARLHMERNNEAAQMLMAYCQKQTGWQSPNERHVSELSAELASHHEAVVIAMTELRKAKPTSWTPKQFEGARGELLLFIQQNRQLCEYLVQARGIGAVLVGLRRERPDLSFEDIEHRRTWLRFATPRMQSLMRSSDGNWPLFVNVVRESKNDDDNSRFKVRVIWANDEFRDGGLDVDALRAHVAVHYPELRKFEGRAYRRLVVASRLDVGAAVKRAVEVAKDMDRLLDVARQDGILS
ncbi:PD-(D/E)XK nuclease family protein (plasmid) [Ralstonia solanacearum]|nr:PD-(D/E)XK nuclease family protein [Ralstonia solanacearum]